MTIKATPAPAHVVRSFLNDSQVWADKYCEEEEFVVDGETRADIENIPDATLVVVSGGWVYSRGTTALSTVTLTELFGQYLDNANETVVVKVSSDRHDELVSLLSQHGFDFSTTKKD